MSEETMAITLPDNGDLPSDRFLDRELSWLAFNQRVLELAEDTTIPLLERVNFAAIFGSNLDEFFMVRVAGLKRRIATGLAVRSASGMEPEAVLVAISKEVRRLQLRHANLFKNDLEPALAKNGIGLITWADLSEEQKVSLKQYFDSQIFPVLTPLAVDPAHPFPYISGLSLNLAVVLREPGSQVDQFARVKVPPLLPRFVKVPGSTATDAKFLPLEVVIGQFLAKLFAGMEVMQHHTFRLTRNEDLEVDED
jgi:polyphosphate kinase